MGFNKADKFQLQDFWAKTGPDNRPALSVYDHCLAVGCVAQAMIELMPPFLRGMIPGCTPILAALHDIGKVSPGFQIKSDIWVSEYEIDPITNGWACSESHHDKVSQIYLQTRNVDLAWSVAVGAHHGKLLSRSSSPIRIKECERAIFSAYREELAQKLEYVLGALEDLDGPTPKESVRWFVAGLISVADWLGSNETYFPLVGMRREVQPLSLIQEKAKECLGCIGWSSELPTIGLSFGDLFYQASGEPLKPYPLQNAVINAITAPGLYIIEGPMGCGKTEAALLAAYRLIEKGHHHGLYFGLPTQTTSNRIYERVEKFLKNCHSNTSINIRLVHANSWLKRNDVTLNRDAHSHHWLAPSRRALLAQYGVGTIDQALLGIVRAKHFFVRQFGLAGKIVILDEVHSYDLYTGTLIDALIKRLLELGCTVLVLSATLTESRRRELLTIAGANSAKLSMAYPLLSGVKADGTVIESEIETTTCKEVTIKCVSLPLTALATECLKLAKMGACVLWIRNTVAEAQESWRLLNEMNLDDSLEIGLLHSRFPYWRREQLEEKWIESLGKSSDKRPKGCVLVSTQIVEQSIDIDSDFLVTDLAPTDMLFQRIGRLWRHERGPSERPIAYPVTWITVPKLENLVMAKEIRTAIGKSSKIYSPYVLLRSHQVWAKRNAINLPIDIRPMLEETYATSSFESESPSWKELFFEIEERRTEMKDLAASTTRVEADLTADDIEGTGVSTRWGGVPTASVLLVKLIDLVDSQILITPLYGPKFTVSSDDKCMDAARIIHENLVKLPYWAVRDACSRCPAWISRYVQGLCAIAVVKNENVVFPEGNSSADLLWDIDEGIVIASPSKHIKTLNMDSENEPCE